MNQEKNPTENQEDGVEVTQETIRELITTADELIVRHVDRAKGGKSVELPIPNGTIEIVKDLVDPEANPLTLIITLHDDVDLEDDIIRIIFVWRRPDGLLELEQQESRALELNQDVKELNANLLDAVRSGEIFSDKKTKGLIAFIRGLE